MRRISDFDPLSVHRISTMIKHKRTRVAGPKSAFTYFKKDRPLLDTAQSLRQAWKHTTAVERQPYQLQATHDKQRFRRESVALQVVQELVAETAGETKSVVASVLDTVVSQIRVPEVTPKQLPTVFYSFYNTIKIPDIPAILDLYRHQLWKMFQDMIRVYGADPRRVFLEYRATLVAGTADVSTQQLPSLFTYRPLAPPKRSKTPKYPKKLHLSSAERAVRSSTFYDMCMIVYVNV